MKKLVLISQLLLFFIASHAQQKDAFGIVFNDCNNNKKFDKGDIPMKGVAVSTLDSITITNINGTFRLPMSDRNIIYVIKPSGYDLSLQENHVPDFYYLNFPEGSPLNFEFKGINPTKALPDTLYFPLYKTIGKKEYQAQMIGDIQAPTIREVRFFRESIVSELLKYPSDFSVCLGDIADNNLNTYPAIEQSLIPLGNPIYMVFGNHDINYQSTSFEWEAETFRRYFGPDYYSFNYGKTHFIVLNTVLYAGWNAADSSNGKYSGSLYPRELNWLRQDLKYTGDASQIVVMAHIPILKNTFDELNLRQVFALLEKTNKPILGIFGHMHQTIAWVYNEELLWKGKQPFNGFVAGAACGAWWGGPYVHDSIPEAICTDGSPRGFYLVNFDDKKTNREFIPAGKPRDYQLRISSPGSVVKIDSLPNTFIYANIFASDRNCRVNFTLDKSIKGQMTNTLELDPFVVRNADRMKNHDDWYPGPVICTHLWKAPLPTSLKPGVHSLEIETTDYCGKIIRSMKVFEVIK